MAMPINFDDMMIILILVVVLLFIAREVHRGLRHGVMHEIARGDESSRGQRICDKQQEPWHFRFLLLFYVTACVVIVVIISWVIIDRVT